MPTNKKEGVRMKKKKEKQKEKPIDTVGGAW